MLKFFKKYRWGIGFSVASVLFGVASSLAYKYKDSCEECCCEGSCQESETETETISDENPGTGI